jgi:hypothetical protein
VLDGGAVEYNSSGGAPTLYAGGSAQPLDVVGPDGYRAEIEYFVECCRTGQPPDFCPPAESAEAVKFMLLLMEARKVDGGKLRCRI